MPEIKFKFIDTQDPLYPLERALRVDVLRRPLGLDAGTEEFPFEKESLHLVALCAEAVIGCLLFRPQGKSGRLYQMAVDEKFRSHGLGRSIVTRMEEKIISEGFKDAYLHARKVSVGFFEKLGYEVYGESFMEIGIEHRLMKKSFGENR